MYMTERITKIQYGHVSMFSRHLLLKYNLFSNVFRNQLLHDHTQVYFDINDNVLDGAQLGINASAKNDSPPTPKIKFDKIAILII